MGAEPRVEVGPPGRDGGRRVRAGTEVLGVAYGPGDLAEFLRRAGVPDVDQFDLAAVDWIDWHGGGPGEWPGGISGP
jgi:hypothetical protein